MAAALRLWPRSPACSEEETDLPKVVEEISVLTSSTELQDLNAGSNLFVPTCRLSPTDDCFVITSFFVGDGMVLSNLSGGFVASWNLDFEESFDGLFYTYSLRPCCQFSLDGDLLSIISNNGRQGITMLGKDHSNSEYTSFVTTEMSSSEKSKSFSFLLDRIIYVGFLPCNSKMIVLGVKAGSMRDENKLLRLSTVSYEWRNIVNTLAEETVDVIDLSVTSILTATLSPDGTVFAMSTSSSCAILYCTNPLRQLMIIQPPDDPTVAMGIGCYVAFNPQFGHSSLSVAYQAGLLQPFKKVDQDFHFSEAPVYVCHNSNDASSHTLINDICFSPDGSFLAIALSNGEIRLIHPSQGHSIYKLDLLQSKGLLSSCQCICVTKSCQEIISCYGDNVLRLWELPRILLLQHICRLAVLACFSEDYIRQCILPTHVVDYLFYQYKYD